VFLALAGSFYYSNFFILRQCCYTGTSLSYDLEEADYCRSNFSVGMLGCRQTATGPVRFPKRPWPSLPPQASFFSGWPVCIDIGPQTLLACEPAYQWGRLSHTSLQNSSAVGWRPTSPASD